MHARSPLVASLAVSISVLAVACSSGPEDPGYPGGPAAPAATTPQNGAAPNAAASATETACQKLCDVQAKGKGCAASSAESCGSLCRLTLRDAPEACQKAASTYFECAMTREWTCPSDSSLATSNDGKCTAEATAYAETCRF